jgi:predicted PolB exonuclease-like 3'-5' exonuclease
MQDGWQVFLPILDHGHQTDLLISDGPNYYRIQVKTVAVEKDHIVHNAWNGSDVDYVVYFVRNGEWGVIAPAFSESKRKLIHDEHQRFEKNAKSFLKAFHLV